ncbi:MAG: hypothetical protein JW965_02020 [Bacteroidales bacterium]|nr:hypothetical protein [Bacteroidales bacterium]
MDQDLSKIKEIRRTADKRILKNPNVIAIGTGFKTVDGKKTEIPSIICSVKEKLPVSELAEKDIIPSAYEGVPTDIVETGIIRAYSNTGRIRPAPGGCSIGHISITAGTLGCLVKKNNEVFILSNNHVLANSNDATIGDPILQPGQYDGGTFPADHIANLYQFIPISFTDDQGTCPVASFIANFLNLLTKLVNSKTRFKIISTETVYNLVDAAIAKPLDDSMVSNEILDIGTINGSVPGELNMDVKKSGRTTGLTTGIITQVDVIVTVDYGGSGVAMFEDQLMAGAMSQPGDSGSAVLTTDNRLVGLLFAGSDSSTVISRIENVFSALGVTV